MEEIKLDVQTRKQVGTRKIRKVRREGFVPAVVYGENEGPLPIQVDRRLYEGIMRSYRGQSVIFHLNVMEGAQKIQDYSAILKEEQFEPVSYQLRHIDFHRISLTKEVEVKVAVRTKGEPPGVKVDGGSLELILWELDIVCLPMKIPAKLEIDVSMLKIGDTIHVKDVALPEGVRTKHDLSAIVVTVVPPMKEEVPGAADEAPKEPEVLKEKKKEPAEGKAGEKTAEKSEKKPAEKGEGK